MVGIKETEKIWPPGWKPLSAETKPPCRGHPIDMTLMRQNPDFPALTAMAFAKALPKEAWQEVSWREGTKGWLQSRFAVARVRPAAGYYKRGTDIVYEIPTEEWLLMEWPDGEPDPTRYWLSTMPESTAIKDLVDLAKLRWRIEEDYENLKQEVGLGDFEGRTW